MADLFHRDGNQLRVSMEGSYDPGITPEIDRQIRHMPQVLDRMGERAAQLKNSTGSSNFEIVISGITNKSQQRPRIYVVPKNNKGIREELADAVLLKAALGMSGQ